MLDYVSGRRKYASLHKKTPSPLPVSSQAIFMAQVVCEDTDNGEDIRRLALAKAGFFSLYPPHKWDGNEIEQQLIILHCR